MMVRCGMPAAARERVKRYANSDHVERRVADVCRAVGKFIAYWGFKEIHGRIWTLLAMRRDALTQAGIARALGVSRALVSGSIEELARHGLVRTVGSHRNAPYVAVFDVWPTIADVLRSREWVLIESARAAFAAALEAIASVERSGARTPYDATRVKALLAMTEVAHAFLRILMRIRTAPGVQSLGGWAGKASGLLERIRRVW